MDVVKLFSKVIDDSFGMRRPQSCHARLKSTTNASFIVRRAIRYSRSGSTGPRRGSGETYESGRTDSVTDSTTTLTHLEASLPIYNTGNRSASPRTISTERVAGGPERHE